MKRYIHATTIDNNLLDSTKQVVEEIAKRYDLLYTTPKDDSVLKGDSFIFKVNDHNVYRVILVPKRGETEVIFQCIAVAYYYKGEEYYDDAQDYKNGIVPNNRIMSIIINWVNECEADDPHYTVYEED